MVIDFEHHYIPAELGRRFGLDPTKKEAVKTRDATVHAQLFDLEAQIRDMDRVGIDVAVQSCILGWDTTLENCRLINDCSGRAQKDFPGRFVGLAHIPPLGGAAALQELERAIRELGLVGVTIPSSFEEYFDRLYFDMAGFEGSPIALRCALEGIRPQRMVFATDYPQNFNNSDPKHGKSVDGVREYIDEVRGLSLDTKIKDNMLGGTAAKLLKIM